MYSNPTMVSIESFLIKCTNSLTNFIFVIGILAYFMFLQTNSYKSPLHKVYLLMRFIICFSRTLVYFLLLTFYIKVLIDEPTQLSRTVVLAIATLFLAIEIMNTMQCFQLYEIIYKKDIDYLVDDDGQVREEQQVKKQLDS